MLPMWKCCQYQIQFPIGNWQHWNWQHLHTGNIKQDICSSRRGSGYYLAYFVFVRVKYRWKQV